MFDLVAPASFDIEASGRLLQIGREMGEFFFFSTLLARFDQLYVTRDGRFRGVTSDFFLNDPFPLFPDVVVKPERKRRIYVNGLLARNEPGSAYAPNRQPWIRERHGHYVPNSALSVRVKRPGGGDAWVPLLTVMNLAWHESHLLKTRGPELVGAGRSRQDSS